MGLSFCQIVCCAGHSRSTLCTPPSRSEPQGLTCMDCINGHPCPLASGLGLANENSPAEEGRQAERLGYVFPQPTPATGWQSLSGLLQRSPSHTHNPACPLLVVPSLNVPWLQEPEGNPGPRLTQTELGSTPQP